MVFIVLVTGCHRAQAPTSEPLRADAGETVSIGDPLDIADRRLLAKGAKPFVNGLIPIPPSTLKCYILADGTCLMIAASPGLHSKQEIITHLTLGEVGRGYADKVDWFAQQRRNANSIPLK